MVVPRSRHAPTVTAQERVRPRRAWCQGALMAKLEKSERDDVRRAAKETMEKIFYVTRGDQ